jgi:hypothetical protein
VNRLRRTLLMAGLALALAACSGISVVESIVTAYASWPSPPVAATWRFERLPSQQLQAAIQGRFEAMTEPLLARAGWRRDDAAPRYLVQVGARSRREDVMPWRGPWGPGFRRGFGWPGPAFESTQYDREVMLVIREVASNQVVFETHAAQESGWGDSDAVWSAMLTAALHEFPNPPAGPRRVGVQVTQ